MGLMPKSRRKYLAAAGSTVAAILAGCSSSSDDNNDRDEGTNQTDSETAGAEDETSSSIETDEDAPAQLEFLGAELSTEETAVRDDVTFSIQIANTGGEPASDTNVPFVLTNNTDGNVAAVEKSISTGTLEPGQTLSEELTFSLNYSGTYVLEPQEDNFEAIRDEPADRAVVVNPVELAAGDTITTLDDLTISVERVVQMPRVYYHERNEPGLLGTYQPYTGYRTLVADGMYTVVFLEVENTSVEQRAVSNDLLRLNTGEQRSSDARPLFGQDQPVASPDVRSLNLNPGETKTGWLWFDVDYDEVSDLSVNAFFDGATEVPDIVLPLDTPDQQPQFEITNIDLSDNVQQEPFRMTVENTGGRSGEFKLDIAWSDSAVSEVKPWPRRERLTVQPGEQRTLEVDLDVEQRYEFRGTATTQWMIEGQRYGPE